MAILYRTPGVIVCGPDADGACKIGRRTYRWEFHHFLGPTFIKAGPGNEPLAKQPGMRHPVWGYFYLWLLDYYRRKKDRRGERNARKILQESHPKLWAEWNSK